MKYLLQYFKTRKGILALIFFTCLAEAFGTLLVPYFVAEIIDVGIAQQSVSTIITLGFQMLVAACAAALISLISSYFSAELSASTGRYLREKLFNQAQLLTLKEFNGFGTASMITRTTGDITVIQQTIIMAAQMILPTPLIAVAAIVMTAIIHPSLIYIPLTALAVFLVVVFILLKKSAAISFTIQGRVDSVNRVVREALTGIRVIRAFDNTEYEKDRMDTAFSAYADNVIRLNKIFAYFNPLVWMIMGLVMVAVAWFGGHLVLLGKIQIGSILAVTEYVILMLTYFIMTAMVLVMLPRMTACLRRVAEVLDTVPEITDEKAETAGTTGEESTARSVQADSKSLTGLQFRHVTFAYRGAEEPVLNDLNFSCQPGKTTAIIGGTGSGKSTVAGLMLRLYDIQQGQILLDGQDIRHMTQHRLREHMGYVPQKSVLFGGTIAHNLRMGAPEASEGDLRQAARIAQADTFIESLEDGYHSHVAQGGTNFS
ncbi:MAG: ABC transporter ATP-binding protein, partial [Lacrimispora sp.]